MAFKPIAIGTNSISSPGPALLPTPTPPPALLPTPGTVVAVPPKPNRWDQASNSKISPGWTSVTGSGGGSGGSSLPLQPQQPPLVQEKQQTSSSNDSLDNINPEAAFSEFYDEVKAIEKRDSTLTNKQQLDRLTRPGATYFNLNPYDVLQIDPDVPLSDVKKKYRAMSILVHPDKNQDDKDRAQKSFEAVNKAYKTLENEEGLKRCKEIVEEAKMRTDEMIKQKRKQLKKEGKPQDVPEDTPDKYKHAVYVQTCKLFADLERLRQERDTKDMHERKRKAEDEAFEEEKKEFNKEWQKNFEESRTGRVDSWRSWSTKKKKTSKGNLKPPKLKTEKRD